MLLIFSTLFGRYGPSSWPVALNWLIVAPRRIYLLKAAQMPAVGDFSPFGPTERIPVSIDFSAQIPVGDSIATVSATLAAYSGTDANASALLYGAANIAGGVVTQWIGPGGVPAVNYRLTLTAVTAAGATLSLYGHIACQAQNSGCHDGRRNAQFRRRRRGDRHRGFADHAAAHAAHQVRAGRGGRRRRRRLVEQPASGRQRLRRRRGDAERGDQHRAQGGRRGAVRLRLLPKRQPRLSDAVRCADRAGRRHRAAEMVRPRVERDRPDLDAAHALAVFDRHRRRAFHDRPVTKTTGTPTMFFMGQVL